MPSYRKTLPTERGPGAGEERFLSTPRVYLWSHLCQKLDSIVTQANLFSLKPIRAI